MSPARRIIVAAILLALLLLIVGCAAGPHSRFADKPAGFWAGLWHGLICVVTFIISLFSDKVKMYEVSNIGRWYDLGFIIGASITLGGTCKASWKKHRGKCRKEKEWDEIGRKVEEKVKTGLREWAEESGQKDEEWEEIGRKIEEKIKRKLREWAEKDDLE